MHQQIRTRIPNFEQGGGEGSLERLLSLIAPQDPSAGPDYNVCVAGYSALDPDVFVIVLEHEEGNEEPVLECLRRIQAEFEDVEHDPKPMHRELENVPGALRQALEEMGALHAREILVGETSEHRIYVHARLG